MECPTCGRAIDCLCVGVRWPLPVRRAMIAARKAGEVYKAAWAAMPLERLRLRDELERRQGIVINLQWAYLPEIGAAKAI